MGQNERKIERIKFVIDGNDKDEDKISAIKEIIFQISPLFMIYSGSLILLVAILITLFKGFIHSTSDSSVVFAISLLFALGSSFMATGFMNANNDLSVKLKFGIKASGPIAIFIIVLFFDSLSGGSKPEFSVTKNKKNTPDSLSRVNFKPTLIASINDLNPIYSQNDQVEYDIKIVYPRGVVRYKQLAFTIQEIIENFTEENDLLGGNYKVKVFSVGTNFDAIINFMSIPKLRISLKYNHFLKGIEKEYIFELKTHLKNQPGIKLFKILGPTTSDRKAAFLIIIGDVDGY